MVRPFEVQGFAAVESHIFQLDNRVRGILPAGSCEPHRQLRIYNRTAKNHPGSHHADNLQRLLGAISQRRSEMELPRRICDDDRSGVFYFQEVVILATGGIPNGVTPRVALTGLSVFRSWRN